MCLRRSLLRWLLGSLVLSLGASRALAGGEPIPPGVTIDNQVFQGLAKASYDSNGDGVLQTDEAAQADGSDPTAENIAATIGPVAGTVVRQVELALAPDGKTLTLTAHVACRSERPSDGDVFEDFGVAEARGSYDLLFMLGDPGSFQISGSTSGSPPHVDGQISRNQAELRLQSTGAFQPILAQAVANNPGAPGFPTSTAESGPIEPGPYSVGLNCETSAPRQIGTQIDAPVAEASADFTLTVTTSECGAEPLRWVGGRAGAFDVAANWDPPTVPIFEEDGRCDTALVQGGRDVVIDLDAAPSLLSSLVPFVGVTRRVGRLVVDQSRSLRPVDGTLQADTLSPVVGERSLELRNGASLLVDGGGMVARHVAVGVLGEGAIDVVGDLGTFETTGRFGLGLAGPGTLRVSGGATVITAEAVIGEDEASGTAHVEEESSLWTTGNLAVGLEADGLLAIEAGGKVDTDTGVIDFNLAGGDRGRVEVRGQTAGGSPSQWKLAALDVGPRGSLAVEGGGRVEVAGPLRIGFEGAATDCSTGRACVDVSDGLLQANGGVVVGDSGEGNLGIGPNGLLAAAGAFTIGSDFTRAFVSIEGPSRDESVFTDLAIATAEEAIGGLTLRNGGRLDLLGRFRIGGPEGSIGGLHLIGAAESPSDTLLTVFEGDAFDSLVGDGSTAPLDEFVATTGVLTLENARLELSGSSHGLVIQRDGTLRADDGAIAIESSAGLVNRGRISGDLIVEGNYVQEATGVLNGFVLSTPGLEPAASGLLLAAATPPPPAFEPVVVTGNATLAGKAKLQFGNGAAPKQGDQFELLDVSGEASGAFDEVEIAGLAPGFDFVSALAGGKLVLTSQNDAQPLPFVNLSGKPSLVETKKGAKVKLTRTGDTTEPLTVAYAVGGTATSGVDYVALPGTIEFPARKKSVKLIVAPIADALDEGTETIEITLTPDASFAPGLVAEFTVELVDKKR